MTGIIDISDEVIETVADWAASAIQEVVDALMPSGRPFGHVEETIENQIIDYIPIRGDGQAWLSFIEEKAQLITQKLQEAGVSPDAILSVHPFDIATKYAINYSAFMEEELRKRA